MIIVFAAYLLALFAAGDALASDGHQDVSYGKRVDDVASEIIGDLYSSLRYGAENLANPADYPPDYRPQDGEQFDFIVVGAGSAGAVVANRLTEEPTWRVLLVEAGGNPSKASELPALSLSLQNTDLDWQYKAGPNDDSCLGMVDRSCSWPRGKVLGGSSVLNYMVYVRGNARDYDNWEAAGNTGWGYDSVLHYFKKSEDMRVPEVLATPDADKYHSTGGYLTVERWTDSDSDSLMEVIGQGFAEAGFPFNTDYNGRNHTGFTRFYGTLQDHKRCSTAKAFLSPVKDRENLRVAKHWQVTKVMIDEETSTAYGVEMMNREGDTIMVRCRKEVVLSAGAINSPQILQLSGVGPQKRLAKLGIPVVKNLPVGENLQDHPLMNSLIITMNFSTPELNLQRAMLEFLTTGGGPLTNMDGLSFSAFISTNNDTNDFPDMQFIPFYFNKNNPQVGDTFRLFNYEEDIIQEFVRLNQVGSVLMLTGSLLRPYSRGRILLRGTDPTEYPQIVPGLLTDKRDMATFLRTYDFLERLVQTDALRRVDAKLHEVRPPGCESLPFPSREFRECSLRHMTSTTYHYCCSCKMGPATDPEAVVDPALRVHGVKGLRVADASVMPCQVSGNINAPTIMLGEKAADLIKESWS